MDASRRFVVNYFFIGSRRESSKALYGMPGSRRVSLEDF
jgi:hypothetical protein